MEKIVVICAHPDDEVLGLGGTLKMHKKKGNKIFVIVVATGQFGRDDSKRGILKRKNQCKECGSILGIDKIEFLDYPDQTLDIVKVSELSSKIQKFLVKWNPSTVYTHFFGDLNQDHRRVFEATSIAVRPSKKINVRNLICFETPSTTEYKFNFAEFSPNYFVDIEKSLDEKIEAIKQYKNEIQAAPYPRSISAIKNRASYWGSQIGKKYAEAFMIIRKIE